ncbi:MAG: HEAT repeat domain-containing protein [Gemmataceae bacterium]
MAGPLFEYPCPHCPQKLHASPDMAGRRVRCPKCFNALRVPHPEPAVDPEDVLGGPLVDADPPPARPAPPAPAPPRPSEPPPTVVSTAPAPSPPAMTPPPVTVGRRPRPMPTVVPLLAGFALAGAVFAGLYAATRPAASVPSRPLPLPAVSAADRLRTALADGRPDAGRRALAEFARPESAADASPADRAAVAGVLARLCDPAHPDPRPGVRAAALTALATWQPDAARDAVLAAVRSDDPAARRAGLGLAGRWKDAEMAAAVADRLADRRDGGLAERALAAIGGPPAEAALLPLLTADDGPTVLTAIELLGKVGGPAAAAMLAELARTGAHPVVREEAARQAAAVAARVSGR